MTNFKELVGFNLKRLLEERGVSQIEFARQVGTTPQTINACINGRQAVSADMIAKMTQALNVSELEFFVLPEKVTPVRTLEITLTREDMLNEVKTAFKILDLITPEMADLIVKADKETKRLLAGMVKDWMTLSDDVKGEIALFTSDMAKKQRSFLPEKRPKSQA